MAIKICLDAGHYAKYNQSPAVKAYYESVMNWKLHSLLKKELESYGFEVIQTRRSQEVDMGLYSRGAASKGCALFLSIHSNAVGNGVNENVDYPVVYVPLNGKGDVIGNKLAKCIEETMGTKQSGRINSRKSSTGGEYYGVIRGAVGVGTIGLILEHSFHTNTKMTKWLLNESNLEKMAKAEAKVIAEHFGMDKPAEFQPYLIKVTCDSLNIRKTPKWDDSDVVGKIEDKGIYTIVGETMCGKTKFGKLKSGIGWVSLGEKYVKRV